MKLVTTSLGLVLVAATALAIPERPKSDMLYIDNGTVKVGIDRAMGASITWLSWNEQSGNIINIHDPGRLLQQSYYAGKTLDRQDDGQSKNWSPWPWNPIQGGGVMSWARVSKFEKRENNSLYALTIPKLWDMHDEEAEAMMHQLTAFEDGMPNVIVVRNHLACKRTPGDRWGPAVPRHQELPACYFISAFRNFESYLGNGKWEKVTQAPGPPWGKTTPKLNVMACFNDEGQGIAVYSPAADQHWNFGPHRKYQASAKPKDGPCVHLAPIGKVELGPQSILEYRYWMVVGTKAEITERIDSLLKIYRNEKLKLENPK